MPKLPPDAASTPLASISAVSIRLNAPRGLNDPVCCNSSSFNVILASDAKAPASMSNTGVRRM
jgi:hypothetical protein